MTDEAPDLISLRRRVDDYLYNHPARPGAGIPIANQLIGDLHDALSREARERDVLAGVLNATECAWRRALDTIDRMQSSCEAADADADAWKEAATAAVRKHAEEQSSVSIERLHAIEVKPGDVIVAKVPRDTNAAACARILTHLQVAFPGHSVITTLADLGVYRPVTGA